MKNQTQPFILWTLLLAGILSAGAGCDMGSIGFDRSTDPTQDHYTVILATFSSNNHMQQANAGKESIVQRTGWDDVFVVHQQGYSRICRGRFRTTEQAQSYLQAAKAFRVENRPAFPTAHVTLLPGQDIGPEEWKLANAPGEYSVHVAIFFDMPENNYIGRKQFAVEYCKRLREHGYDAYYHHGPVRSNVLIGAFPESAIRITQVPLKHPETGDVYYEERNIIEDPRMLKIMEDFPQMQINGSGERQLIRNPRTGRAEWKFRETKPMRIPRDIQDGSGEAILGV